MPNLLEGDIEDSVSLVSINSIQESLQDKSGGLFDNLEKVSVKRIQIRHRTSQDRKDVENPRINPVLNRIIEENSEHSG